MNIVKYTDLKISNNLQLQNFISEAKTIANVVFPETLPFSRYCNLKVEIVTVDVNNDKHVYQNENGSFSLHLSKLNEIAKAAKIRVVGSRILQRVTDDTGKVTFISHEVTVQYRIVSGEMITESYTGKYDYFSDLATKSEKQTKSRRKHAEALAESNALYRAFNKVLPQLPQSFSKADLSKPFLIPYVEEDKNALLNEFTHEEQKEIKKEIARKRLGLMDTIYGTSPAINKNTKVPGNVEEANIVFEQQNEQSNKNHIIAESFRQSSQKERTEKILSLIKLKGWKHPLGAIVTERMIEKAPLDTQISRIEELLNMPDAEGAEGAEGEVSL